MRAQSAAQYVDVRACTQLWRFGPVSRMYPGVISSRAMYRMVCRRAVRDGPPHRRASCGHVVVTRMCNGFIIRAPGRTGREQPNGAPREDLVNPKVRAKSSVLQRLKVGFQLLHPVNYHALVLAMRTPPTNRVCASGFLLVMYMYMAQRTCRHPEAIATHVGAAQ